MSRSLTTEFYWPETRHLFSMDIGDDLNSGDGFPLEWNDQRSTQAVAHLKESGFFRLVIPSSLGGLGATLAECCAVHFRLGFYDPNLAIRSATHHSLQGMMVSVNEQRPGSLDALLGHLAANDIIVSSAFDEPETGGWISRSGTTASRVADGYVLNGVKSACGFSRHSGYFCLQALVNEALHDNLIVALIPSSALGALLRSKSTSECRMQDTSNELILSASLVPDKLVLHRSRPGIHIDDTLARYLVWSCLTGCSTYLGLCRRLLVEATAGVVEPSSRVQSSMHTLKNVMSDLYSILVHLEMACAGLATCLTQNEVTASRALHLALSLKKETLERGKNLAHGLAVFYDASLGSDVPYLSGWANIAQTLLFQAPNPFVSSILLGRLALGDPEHSKSKGTAKLRIIKGNS